MAFISPSYTSQFPFLAPHLSVPPIYKTVLLGLVSLTPAHGFEPMTIQGLYLTLAFPKLTLSSVFYISITIRGHYLIPPFSKSRSFSRASPFYYNPRSLPHTTASKVKIVSRTSIYLAFHFDSNLRTSITLPSSRAEIIPLWFYLHFYSRFEAIHLIALHSEVETNPWCFYLHISFKFEDISPFPKSRSFKSKASSNQDGSPALSFNRSYPSNTPSLRLFLSHSYESSYPIQS